MENQDQLRRNSSGHEGRHGVHLCHKCGWPFPNPHPSPKHRRAHKRICGTIEGYKLENSEGKTISNLDGSDDESPSPSPRGLRITAASQDSGSGIGSRSSASSTSLDNEGIVDAVGESSGDNTATREVVSDAVKETSSEVRNLSKEIDRVSSDAAVEKDNVGDHLVVDENVTALTTSTGVDADVVETEKLMSLTEPGSHEKEPEEASVSAALETEAKVNEKVVPIRNDTQHESVPPEAASKVCKAVAAVPEEASVETLDAVEANLTKETTGDGLETLTDSSAVVDSVREIDSFIESSNSFGGTVQADRSAKMAESDDKRTEEDRMCFHDLKVAEDLPSQENAPRENESEELSGEDLTLGSRSSVEYSNPVDGSVESTVSTGTELVESDSQEVDSIKEYTNSFVAESGSNSKVAGEESPVTVALPIQSDGNTETQVDQTISSIEHADAHNYDKDGIENVVSGDGEEEVSGAADAGLLSEPALITPKSNEDADSGPQLETKAEITDEQTISSREGGNKAHDCENVNVDANVNKVRGTEEQKLGKTNEVSELAESHVPIMSENPSHQEDIVEIEDGGEDLNKTDAKLVARESIPPIDGSDVTNEGTTAEVDMVPISGDDADLNLVQETIGSSDDKVVGNVVDDPQSSHVAGSHTKEPAHDITGDHDESSQAQGGKDVGHHDVISSNDVLADSIGQTDSLEANQISGSAPTEVEAIPSSNSEASAEKEMASLKHEGGVGSQQSDSSDLIDLPSFMTLVEPKAGDFLNENVSEQKDSPSSQPGWFPTVAHVAASNSSGRKRNEEIIDKVSKSQRVALRSLLGEAYDDEKKAKPPSGKENDPVLGTKNGNFVTDTEKEADAGKDWNSSPKYLTKSKSGKGKARSWWSPFICCSSVNSGEISQ